VDALVDDPVEEAVRRLGLFSEKRG